MARKIRHAIADTGPVLTLALIAAAGSFTHIRDTAAENGQTGWMSWAVAVCVDLLCVMAARERQRDARTERSTRRVSWPTFVLSLGVLLSLAANLAQAVPTKWGYVVAATPCAAFLVAVSMLERRAGAAAQETEDAIQETEAEEPEAAATEYPGGKAHSHPGPTSATVTPIGTHLARARKAADDYMTEHGKWITRDVLRREISPCSSAQASALLRQLKGKVAA